MSQRAPRRKNCRLEVYNFHVDEKGNLVKTRLDDIVCTEEEAREIFEFKCERTLITTEHTNLLKEKVMKRMAEGTWDGRI